MPTIVVPAGVSPCQVEVPDTIKDGDAVRKVERSVVMKKRGDQLVEEPTTGSLHVRPARSMNLTEDEWAVLSKARPDIAKKAIVSRPAAKQEPKPVPKAPAPKAPEPAPEKESSSLKGLFGDKKSK